MRRLLITGTGRSGTAYCAHLLRSCGLEVGHEDVFDDEVALRERAVEWGSFDAECSWMAAPRLPLLGVVVALVVRHPLAYVRSQVDLGFFQDPGENKYGRVIAAATPAVYSERTEHDRALHHWCAWHALCMPWVDHVARLESLDVTTLLAWASSVGWALDADVARAAIEGTHRGLNAKRERKRGDWDGTWGDFRPQLADLAHGMAYGFGYGREIDALPPPSPPEPEVEPEPVAEADGEVVLADDG